jgi:release factor glutamine methyltransferase
MKEIWTIKRVLDFAAVDFADKGFESPRLEAELLLSSLLNVNRIYLYTNFDRPLQPDELAEFRNFIARRRAGEPASYIIGKKEFWSMDFYVTPDVLVPRPDTETLLEAAMPCFESASAVLDLCTGSGCLAVVIAKTFSHLRVDATDISPKALDIARKNARFHEISDNLSFYRGDLFDALPKKIKYDVIITNPPYVIGSVIDTLAPEVQKEPRMALDGGGSDGLDIIRRLLMQAPDYLSSEGKLFVELDPAQADLVANSLGPSFLGVKGKIIKDFAQRERVVSFEL